MEVCTYEKEFQKGCRLYIKPDQLHREVEPFRIYLWINGFTIGYFDKKLSFVRSGVTQEHWQEILKKKPRILLDAEKIIANEAEYNKMCDAYEHVNWPI